MRILGKHWKLTLIAVFSLSIAMALGVIAISVLKVASERATRKVALPRNDRGYTPGRDGVFAVRGPPVCRRDQLDPAELRQFAPEPIANAP